MTYKDFLSSLSFYPLPAIVLAGVASEVGIDLAGNLEVGSSAARHAEALIYRKLSTAASISENGRSISISDADKARFAKMASAILAELGLEDITDSGAVGYVGCDF